MAADDRLARGGVDPGPRAGLERVVGLAAGPPSPAPPGHLAPPPARPPGALRTAVYHRARVVEGAQQPPPRVRLEVRVLRHARADGRVGDLKQERVAGGAEQARTPGDPPGDSAARRDQLGRLLARGEERLPRGVVARASAGPGGPLVR